MKYDLAISIVVYKKYEDAVDAVRSIEKNTGSKLKKRIFIIDNSCLPDDVAGRKRFEQEMRSYEDVVYIDTKKNLGFGKGHNFTMDRLSCDYFAIVNPDILLTEGAFERILEYMEDKKVGMAIPKIVDETGNLQDAYRRQLTVFDMLIRMFVKKGFQKRRDYHSMKEMDYSAPFEVPFGQGSFLVIRTDLWKELHGFDDDYFMYLEDADLCRRVNLVSRLMYCPKATVIHKWKKGSHRNVRLFIIHVRSMITYFNKWGWKLV